MQTINPKLHFPYENVKKKEKQVQEVIRATEKTQCPLISIGQNIRWTWKQY